MTSTQFATEPIPPAALASDAYATGAITTREYNAALRVVEIAAIKRPICETVWGAVRAGDLVLTPGQEGDQLGIAKLTVATCSVYLVGDRLTACVFFEDRRGVAMFDAADTAYVQQRA